MPRRKDTKRLTVDISASIKNQTAAIAMAEKRELYDIVECMLYKFNQDYINEHPDFTEKLKTGNF